MNLAEWAKDTTFFCLTVHSSDGKQFVASGETKFLHYEPVSDNVYLYGMCASGKLEPVENTGIMATFSLDNSDLVLWHNLNELNT